MIFCSLLSQEQDIPKVSSGILLVLEFGSDRVNADIWKTEDLAIWGRLPGPGDSLHFNMLSLI